MDANGVYRPRVLDRNICLGNVRQRHRELAEAPGAMSRMPLYNLMLGFAVRCAGDGWCICHGHARWSTYCAAGAAIAVATGEIIFPPENFDDRWDEHVEWAVWPALEEALASASCDFPPRVRELLLRTLIPALMNGPAYASEFAMAWESDAFIARADPDSGTAKLRREVGEYAQRMLDIQPDDVRETIERIASLYPKLREIYRERRLPRLKRAMETDRAVRMSPSY